MFEGVGDEAAWFDGDFRLKYVVTSTWAKTEYVSGIDNVTIDIWGHVCISAVLCEGLTPCQGMEFVQGSEACQQKRGVQPNYDFSLALIFSEECLVVSFRPMLK